MRPPGLLNRTRSICGSVHRVPEACHYLRGDRLAAAVPADSGNRRPITRPGDGSTPMENGRALVLGGGGVAGIAWITGLLTGLAEAGDDVTGAELLIGTSAGAAAAAQLGSGLPLAELLARQTDPAKQAAEIPAEVDLARLGAEIGAYLTGVSSPQEYLQRIGAYALDAKTVPESARRAVIESRLPGHDWPDR